MCCIVKCCNCHFISAGDMAGVAFWGLVCVCVHAVGKMAKCIGMTICKSIMVSFLPCLVAFLAFHPYIFFQNVINFVTCFCCFFGGGGGGEKVMDRCGCTAAACSYMHA